MSNPILSKSFKAEAAIKPYRILTAGSAAGTAIHAPGPNQMFLGISENVVEIPADKTVDCVRSGISLLEYGDIVSVGDPLTSDDEGRAVPAIFDEDDHVFIIGFAEFAGVEGDVQPVEIVKALVPDSVVASETDVLVANTTISSVELLALNATPKSLVAAPGADKALVPHMVIAHKPAGTAYDGIAAGEDIAIRYTDGSGTALVTIETTGFLDQATAQTRVALLPTAANFTPTANAALVAHMTAGEITTGNSPVKLRTLYRIIDTVL